MTRRKHPTLWRSWLGVGRRWWEQRLAVLLYAAKLIGSTLHRGTNSRLGGLQGAPVEGCCSVGQRTRCSVLPHALLRKSEGGMVHDFGE